MENYSLFYLERYASSSNNFRRVLTQRVDRSCKHHGTDFDECMELVEDLIKRYIDCELLNDKNYAITKIRGLRRKGNSSKMIFAKLMQKGVSSNDIDHALNIIDEEISSEHNGQTVEFTSALKHAKRKKLGNFRIRESNKENIYERDLASLARAGYSYDISKKVLEFEEED